MVFSKYAVNLDLLKAILINNIEVDYVEKIKYLGVTISSEPAFTFSADADLRSFYRSVNSILNVVKKPDEAIQMYLLYTNCVPIVTYACQVKEFSARQMSLCNTALNDAIRKVFTYQRWESVRLLRESLGYKSLYEIFAISKKIL